MNKLQGPFNGSSMLIFIMLPNPEVFQCLCVEMQLEKDYTIPIISPEFLLFMPSMPPNGLTRPFLQHFVQSLNNCESKFEPRRL